MKVYLLKMDDGRCVFYSEASPVATEDAASAPRDGLRGWAERKYQKLQTVLHESEGGVGLRMRRAWAWLQRRASPDESLLRALRGAQTINLFHPATMSAEEALAAWEHYLAVRRPGLMLWLTVNALVAPLSLVLAPVPGPNVIGYWFVYRAVCHLLALLGVRRACSKAVTTKFAPLGELDEIFNEIDGERFARLSEGLGLKGLEPFVREALKKSAAARSASLAVS